MSDRESASSHSQGQGHNHDPDADPKAQEQEQEQEQITGLSNEEEVEEQRKKRAEKAEARFAYMLGTYAVRFFLRKMDDFANTLEARTDDEARRQFERALDGGDGGVGVASLRKAGVRKVVGMMRLEGVRRRLRLLVGRVRREERELCFGEIGSDDEDEKGGRAGVVRDGAAGGLLWYYGANGVLAWREKEKKRLSEGPVNEVCWTLLLCF